MYVCVCVLLNSYFWNAKKNESVYISYRVEERYLI